MVNDLRTDIVCNKELMTKEEAEAYDAFIDFLVERCREYVPLPEEDHKEQESAGSEG